MLVEGFLVAKRLLLENLAFLLRPFFAELLKINLLRITSLLHTFALSTFRTIIFFFPEATTRLERPTKISIVKLLIFTFFLPFKFKRQMHDLSLHHLDCLLRSDFRDHDHFLYDHHVERNLCHHDQVSLFCCLLPKFILPYFNQL